MYKIVMEKECGCFKKSGFQNNREFDRKEDAVMEAKVMECRMNQEFCQKHYFMAVDKGDEILITVSLREEMEGEE